MELIRNYIEGIFSGLPKTKEIIEMKLNMIDNMEEKYNALLDEGKNENEAIGIVISQFGNIEELKSELGIKDEEEQRREGYSEKVDANYKEMHTFAGNEGYHENNSKPWKRDMNYEAFSGILWTVIVVIFLFLGFVFNLWHPGWIIFLLATPIQICLEYVFKRNWQEKTREK